MIQCRGNERDDLMDNSPTHTQRIFIVDDWDALMVQINDFAIAQKVGKSVRIAIDGCQRLSRSALAGVDVPCLLYTSPSPRDLSTSRMPSSA